MSHYQDAPELAGALLGQTTEYKDSYDASLLFPIPRKLNRDEINIDDNNPPFKGEDVWTGYELSWLNQKGKPVVAVAEFFFDCRSPYLIESKSFKLYLNSFNQTQFANFDDVKATLINDLSKASQSKVNVTLYTSNEFDCLLPSALPGHCIDDLDIAISEYNINPNLLKHVENAQHVEETLHSHLLKSNCLITSQPDWGSLIVRYQGKAICHESLLKYVISFRGHNEFHEQCVERIYADMMANLELTSLEVLARYTRRGGLDINPYRSTNHDKTQFRVKTNRQ